MLLVHGRLGPVVIVLDTLLSIHGRWGPTLIVVGTWEVGVYYDFCWCMGDGDLL